MARAIGRHLATLDQKILLISSGGLSHDPSVPRLATATPQQRRMLMGEGGPLSPEARDARQQRVIAAAREFAAGTATIQDLAPEWDRKLLKILDCGDLTPSEGGGGGGERGGRGGERRGGGEGEEGGERRKGEGKTTQRE